MKWNFENKNFFFFSAKLSTFTWATNFECMFDKSMQLNTLIHGKGGPFRGIFKMLRSFCTVTIFFKIIALESYKSASKEGCMKFTQVGK